MRYLSYLVLFASLLVLCNCTTEPSGTVSSEKEVKIRYDSLLAERLGADDYGMKTYVMAFLYRGDSQGLDSLRRSELQREHLDNITRMAEEGQLVLAGPFLGKGDLRGIYLFDVRTVAEAEALTRTDPAIQAGTLRMELREWYGSAALMKLNELHKQIAKENI